MLRLFVALGALGLRGLLIAAVCVRIAEDSESESLVRDFERARGGVGTLVKLPGSITDKLVGGNDARAAGVDTSGLGLTLELMARGDTARCAEPWVVDAASPV